MIFIARDLVEDDSCGFASFTTCGTPSGTAIVPVVDNSTPPTFTFVTGVTDGSVLRAVTEPEELDASGETVTVPEEDDDDGDNVAIALA
jgi:hypothetical protein